MNGLGLTNRVLIAYFSITVQAFAGGGMTGGASEWTQIMNWAKLAESATTEAATLISTLNTLDVAIRNAVRNPLGILPKSELLGKLNHVMNNLQDIGRDMNEIDARWSHAYLDPPDGRLSTKFKLANNRDLASAKGALEMIAQQQEVFSESVATLDRLKLKLKGDSGTNATLDTIAQVELSVADVAHQILTTLQSQQIVLANYVSGQASRDQTTRDVSEKIMSFVNKESKPSGKDVELSDLISKPERGINF